MDFDGNASLSNVVVIDNEENSLFVLTANTLVKNTLDFSLSTDNAGYITVKVYDTYGKNVISEGRQVNSGDNNLSIDVSRLNSGMYFLVVSQNGQSVEKKIVKE